MVRYRSDRFPNGGINRWQNDGDHQIAPDLAKCIGSACMMWRWEMESVLQMEGDGIHRSAVRPSKKNGYCGLAGKP
jgi:hypothetical protein